MRAMLHGLSGQQEHVAIANCSLALEFEFSDGLMAENKRGCARSDDTFVCEGTPGRSFAHDCLRRPMIVIGGFLRIFNRVGARS